MQVRLAPAWGQRVFVFAAIILGLFHSVLLLALRFWSAEGLLSNLLQLSSALLAAVTCLYASRRLQGFGKHFWLLASTGFFLWSAAQLVATYYDSILHAPMQGPWPSDIIFFLSMAPAFMTLFIDPQTGFQWKDWPRLFDMTQVIIFTVACYLFSFEAPADWQHGWGAVARLAWIPETGRDVLLLGAFSFASLLSRQKLARDLYGRMALFSFAYLGGEIPYLYLQSTRNLRTGTLWDLAWSLPFVVATVLAATSQPVEESAADRAQAETARSSWSEWGLVHVISLIFPLVVLFMAAGIAQKALLQAVAMVLASFSCSIARIFVGEQQQRHAARLLEERNALLKSVFDGTGDAIFVKDIDGRYLMVNDRVAEFYGKPSTEIIGKKPEQLTDATTAHELTKDDHRILETGEGITSEFRLPGDKRSFLVTRSPYRDASGKISGIIGISRDITEYRLIEERLRQSQKMEAIGTLAGGVAHDFNNILMVIGGYGSVLSKALSSHPKLRAHVDQIQKAAERAASLTKQLLAFSRKQAIQPAPLNLNSVVSGIEKLLHRLIGENIAISAKLDPRLWTVLADAGQMEQVILNLAVNARDAMPTGGQLTLQTKNIQIHDAAGALKNLKPGQYVELVVSDTGVGMDVNVQSRIFEPFFTTKPLGKGTGLGLSTVYGIVQQANGHVTFTSQPGGGTTFRVYLPRIDSGKTADAHADAFGAALDGRETVLLVEDDSAVCELVRAVLISHGYNVLAARRPQEAENLCEQQQGQIDLLLSDVVMPEMSGGELSVRLLEKRPAMKVLFMSGYIDEAVLQQGIREKKVAFLQKPFSPLSLARRVREVLDGQPVH